MSEEIKACGLLFEVKDSSLKKLLAVDVEEPVRQSDGLESRRAPGSGIFYLPEIFSSITGAPTNYKN